jgi:mono/diheme cytochrome c family protein
MKRQMGIKALAAASVIAISGCSGSYAQEVGNASRGETYVRQNCADCHAVDRQTSQSPDRNAPRFEAVANTPGMTPMALAAWLNTSHPTMPNLIVRGANHDDVIAYIRSLKRPPSAARN